MSKRKGKIIKRFFLIFVTIMLLVLSASYIFIKTSIPNSFPIINGQLNIPGLIKPVNIYRDEFGIPNIYASSAHDLFLAQGYVHAQDRFWQMDFWRHIGSGTLSEMFPSELKTDIFLRTLGWRKIAEQEYKLLDPDSKSLLDAYAEGINAYLIDHKGTELSLEYGILKLLNPNYEPSEWTPIHTLTWAKSMAWDLGDNMDNEIDRAILLNSLSIDEVNELYPSYPDNHPVIVPTIGENVLYEGNLSNNSIVDSPDGLLKNVSEKISDLSALLGTNGDEIGSNNWVVSGKLTNTGKPLLANDPHLGIQMPSIWYQLGLHCRPKNFECPYDVSGFSFAGVPGIVIGHNDRIAWGVTNVAPDVQDLFIEKINPENNNQYEYLGNWVDMELRQEIIMVAGKDPVEITVRSTIHGPIISDSYGPLKQEVEPSDTSFTDKAGINLPDEYAIALSWTALEPTSLFNAIWGFDKAQNWDEFRMAAKDFVVPAQNLVYADIDGNIGYQMPGNIPIRKSGDGRLPVPGWSGEFDWSGYIPFEDLPYLFNPKIGFIATANNQVNPKDYPYIISKDFDYGFRADRIVSLLASATNPIDIAYIKSIQRDNYDASAAILVPILLQTNLDNPDLNQYRALLKDWDFQDDMNSAPAALYSTFWKYFLTNTFGDDLPVDMQPAGSSRWFEVTRNMATNISSHWWDSSLTPEKIETRDDIFELSFSQAVEEVKFTLGNDPANWRWGDLHLAIFRNQTLGNSGISPIEMLFNRGPFQTSGGASIINATGWNASKGFELISLPSLRMIVDLNDMQNSLTVHTTGQSGHAYNKNYIDMVDLWRNFQYYPMVWNEEDILTNSIGHLVLSP